MTCPFRQATNLSELPRVAHGFFGRAGGVSEGLYASLNCGAGSHDTLENVQQNRHLLAQTLGAQELVSVHQIHSPSVVVWEQPWDAPPQADAIVTTQKHVAIGALTADCVPVLFADADAGVIACAHAGWKGALSGVIQNTVEAMCEQGAARANIRAAIGPCIAQDSYEVGEELRQHFLQQSRENDRFFGEGAEGKYWFDVGGYALAQCEAAGLEHTQRLALDTYMLEKDYYSYRRATHREETDYGRQVSAIALI